MAVVALAMLVVLVAPALLTNGRELCSARAAGAACLRVATAGST